MSPLFATCSYQEFRPDMGTPVRSSIGFPRWQLKYPLTHAMPSTFPNRTWLRGVAKPRFDELYAAKMDGVGIDALREQAERIRWDEAHALRDDRLKERPVVLLCFERWNTKKHDPELWCHRHSLAAWLRANGETEVPELGALPHAEIRAHDTPQPDEQPGLF